VRQLILRLVCLARVSNLSLHLYRGNPRIHQSIGQDGVVLGQLKYATRGVGARRERTRPEQFLDLVMPMPDVQQQAKAVGIFAELDALKRLQADTAAEIDALLSSVLERLLEENCDAEYGKFLKTIG